MFAISVEANDSATAHDGKVTSFLNFSSLKCAADDTDNSCHVKLLVGLHITNVFQYKIAYLHNYSSELAGT